MDNNAPPPDCGSLQFHALGVALGYATPTHTPMIRYVRVETEAISSDMHRPNAWGGAGGR